MSMEPFTLPLAEPLATAHGEVAERRGFLVRYEHRGRVGLGEATPWADWTESRSACRSTLADALATAERDGHESALLDLEVADAPAARHGFTTALLDADARAEDVPLYRWLAPDRECRRVPVNATLGDADPVATAEAAAAAVERGVDCLKLKVGVRSLDADRERVAAVRAAVGDAVALRVDANGAWDRATAESALADLAEYGVDYVEQPLPEADLDGLAALRGGPVGVAVDESLRSHRVSEVLEADAADVLVCKPMVLGGAGDAHTIAMRAREAGVDPVVTTTYDGVVARTAAVHVAAAIPDVRACGLATASALDRDLGPDPAPVQDGAIAVPQDPGLGVDPGAVSP